MEIKDSKENIAQGVSKMENAIEHLEEELKTFRAGKANPAVLNSVMVDYYGSPTPVPKVASVSVPDPKSMIVQPWEKKMVAAIVKAIMDANLGFTPINNGENIRINIPPLTEERRKELCKQARAAGESAKMSIRNARRDVVEAHKKFKKDGLEEDVCKDAEVEIQKKTDSFVKKVDELVAAKEKEIMTV
ncbi:MAG: ribosome recycling factor [Bacteroidales bacterium]|nr:ribosome recycling factor [Bacteroidales bacterium]